MKTQLYYSFENGVKKQGSFFSWKAIVAMLLVALILAAYLIFSGELEKLLR